MYYGERFNIDGSAIKRVEDGEDQIERDSWEKNSQERAVKGGAHSGHCAHCLLGTGMEGRCSGAPVVWGNGQERLF